MKIFKYKDFWYILIYIICLLISLGFDVLIVLALIKLFFN